mmetsp:Transcript_14379/g.26017  ORF Transcript_14379/g.26017 Transcript_14379/m.26017 type:complete len:83 (-) Transcript_14379:214-462(-)
MLNLSALFKFSCELHSNNEFAQISLSTTQLSRTTAVVAMFSAKLHSLSLYCLHRAFLIEVLAYNDVERIINQFRGSLLTPIK